MAKQSPQAKGDEILMQLTKQLKHGMPHKVKQKNYVLNMAVEAVDGLISTGYNEERIRFWTEVKKYLLTRKA